MRSRSIRLGTGALALTLGLTACAESAPTGPEPAPPDAVRAETPGQLVQGQQPLTGIFHDAFPGVVCGIPVTVDVFDAGATWPAPSVGGVPSPPLRETGRNVIRWTNEANGQWMESAVAGQATQEVVETYEDGSFRIHRRYNQTVRYRGPTGPAYALSAGTFVLEFTVVPQGGGGFILTDAEFLFVAGPNDAAPLGSPPFCAIVEDALL